MRRIVSTLLNLCLLAACAKVDSVLEGHVAPNAHLSIAVAPTPLTVTQGAEASLTATITRVGDYTGPVTVLAEDLPAGLTATIASSGTGQITTSGITIRAAADAKTGSYLVTFRVKGNELTDATTPLQVEVVAPSSFTLAVSSPALVLTAGGSAPTTVQVGRTNLSAPVKLTLEGAAGFTLAAGENPLSNSTTTAIISSSASVVAGSYALTLKGTATGASDQAVNFTVMVTNDPFQLLVRPVIAMLEGATLVENVIVNRTTYSGSITPSVTGLPASVNVAVSPNPLTGVSGTLTFAADPDTPTGNYTGTLTATANGQVVTSPFALTIQPSNVGVSLTPTSVSILPASVTSIAVSLSRTSLTAPIALSVTGLPSGVTATFDSSTVAGNSATLSISASAAAAPGQYTLTVRAAPQSWSTASGRTASLGLTIRSSGATTNNVLLDWSSCTSPVWVAYKDGAGPWTQVTGSAGQFRFGISSAVAGYAYAEGFRGTTAVRYLTQDEITKAPFDMCPVLTGTKTATASVFRANMVEQLTFSLGGGTATTTSSSDEIKITGIRDGVQDLIGWGVTFSGGTRGMLRRDVNVPDGGSLGTVSLIQNEAFAAATGALVVQATSPVFETSTYTMNYASTAACVSNTLYTNTTSGVSVAGVPAGQQRNSDYHVFSVSRIGTISAVSSTRRTVTTSFHTLGNLSLVMPVFVSSPQVTSVAGSYKRLQATFTTVPAEYNRTVVLSYSDGTGTMTVGASPAYLAAQGTLTVAMPDFAGVSGWNNTWALASSAAGAWSATVDGESVPGNACTEGRRVVSMSISGVF